MCANCDGCRVTRDGCKYFIYGKASKSSECYWEKTESASCPDGWEDDSYDFYSISAGGAELPLFDKCILHECRTITDVPLAVQQAFHTT